MDFGLFFLFFFSFLFFCLYWLHTLICIISEISPRYAQQNEKDTEEHDKEYYYTLIKHLIIHGPLTGEITWLY